MGYSGVESNSVNAQEPDQYQNRLYETKTTARPSLQEIVSIY